MTVVYRRVSIAASLLAGAAMVLVGCSDDGDSTAESVTVEETTTAGFQPEEVDTVVAEKRDEPVKDPGLNVEWELQQNSTGLNGGTIITVKLHNLNDMPLPKDAFDPPVLTLGDGTEVERLDAEDAGIKGMDGLDLPLGEGASVNLRYAFDTYDVSGATFRIGNVEWRKL